jgi:hypothetical protein
LIQPLIEDESLEREFDRSHTMPISDWAWRQHAHALARSLETLADSLPAPPDDFNAIRDWVAQIRTARSNVISLLLALEPFTPFDTAKANDVVCLVEVSARAAADIADHGLEPATIGKDIRALAAWWERRSAGEGGEDPLTAAFALPTPPTDSQGKFRADWVLQHYSYRHQDLLRRLLPHLESLGVPGIVDMLAGIAIVGGVLECDDPVAAYVAMDSFVNHYLACDEVAADLVLNHLETAEPALRRTRQAAARARSAATLASADLESRALALAEAYKRVLEGPFRQFTWALHCLKVGAWERPPMLAELRQRLVAGGGLLASVAHDVIVPDLRNSETHETLEWDGFREEYVTEGGRVGTAQVALALVVAESFAHGCEAGLTAVRSLRVPTSGNLLPTGSEMGRMPSWRRVEAFFGTNRLKLTQANLNTRHAFLRVERLAVTDVNPCFQALILARRLLPGVETFSVAAGDRDVPLIVVRNTSLDAAMPAWERAVATLDQMPLSTFLPVNLDARGREEEPSLATRSVAWIAVDDALGVIDGSPESWSAETAGLIQARLEVVAIAVECTLSMLDAPNSRLASVLQSVQELRDWISQSSAPEPDLAEGQPAVRRLRIQWERWGPVPRHPNIPDSYAPDLSERQPALRAEATSTAYRTL